MKSIISKSETSIPSININNDVGVKLAINNDQNRIIRFNPEDVGFIQRVYSLVDFYNEREKHYISEYDKLDEDHEVEIFTDDEGNEVAIPHNAGGKIELVNKMCDEMNEKIDEIFGSGTSEILFQGAKAFGDSNETNQYLQFFSGIKPYISTARESKISKYTGKGGKVMK